MTPGAGFRFSPTRHFISLPPVIPKFFFFGRAPCHVTFREIFRDIDPLLIAGCALLLLVGNFFPFFFPYCEMFLNFYFLLNPPVRALWAGHLFAKTPLQPQPRFPITRTVAVQGLPSMSRLLSGLPGAGAKRGKNEEGPQERDFGGSKIIFGFPSFLFARRQISNDMEGPSE